VSCNKNKVEPNNSKGVSSAVFNPDITYGTMTDQEGNVYKTVTIGTQTWMAENLRTTLYNDSTPIPHVTVDSDWSTLTTGAFCNLHNTTDVNFIATYGRLYNWHAINTGKLAPTGWHVPTDAEWTTLVTFLGGSTVAGGELKEVGSTHWQSVNVAATNSSGFTGLPGSQRNPTGTFRVSIGLGQWWSSTPNTGSGLDVAFSRYLYYGYGDISTISEKKVNGFSVRLVMD